jgi:hypothetical protein
VAQRRWYHRSRRARACAVGTHEGDGQLSDPAEDTPRPAPGGAPPPTGGPTPPAGPGTPPPGDGGASPEPAAGDRGVRYGFTRAKDSLRRMIDAHVALAKAELGLITDRAKVALALVAGALALVVFAALVVTVGTPLFLGEWIFGSMGWGILHAVLFGFAVAVALVLKALDFSAARLGWTLVAAAFVGFVIGGIFFLNLPHNAWVWVGDQVDVQTTLDIDPAYRPLAVAAAIGAIVGAVLGLIIGIWKGRSFSGAIGGLLGGAIALGALCAFTAISFSVECAVGLGIAVMLAVWPVFASRPLLDGSFDWDAFAASYWPGLTIETIRSTIEEVKLRLPDMPSRPGRPSMPGRGGQR